MKHSSIKQIKPQHMRHKQPLSRRNLVHIMLFILHQFPKGLNAANRTRRDCPIEGCSSRNLKSISDHLKMVHKITDRAERLLYCYKAKDIYVSVMLNLYFI